MKRYQVYKRFRTDGRRSYYSKRDMSFNKWTLYNGDDIIRIFCKMMEYIEYKELRFLDIEKNYKKQVNDFMRFIYENSYKRDIN